MKRHLICMDIDGTLLNSAQQISENTIQLIQELQKEDHLFYVATGRMYQSAHETARKISPITAVLASNGGIYNLGAETKEHLLAPETALAIYRIAKSKQLPLFFFSKDAVYYSEFLPDYFVDKGDQGRVTSGTKQNFHKIFDEDEFAQYCSKFINGIIISEDNPDGLTLGKIELSRIPNLHVTSSFSNNIELMPMHVNKANAIKEIQEFYGIPTSNVITFGDGENDKEMIEAAGIGVAMENATQSIKEIAAAVTASNNEEGIYQFLNSYFNSSR